MSHFPVKVVCVSDEAYLGSDEQGRVKAATGDERLTGSLTVGKTYLVLGEDLGMYALVDDTGEEYLFPKDRFRRVE